MAIRRKLLRAWAVRRCCQRTFVLHHQIWVIQSHYNRFVDSKGIAIYPLFAPPRVVAPKYSSKTLPFTKPVCSPGQRTNRSALSPVYYEVPVTTVNEGDTKRCKPNRSRLWKWVFGWSAPEPHICRNVWYCAFWNIEIVIALLWNSNSLFLQWPVSTVP